MDVGPSSEISRQRSWLCRDGKKSQSWRPQTIYRCVAKRWLQNVDCQVRHVFNDRGLKLLCFNASLAEWQNWRTYPYCLFSQDLGSDGVCGYQAFTRYSDGSGELWGDSGHGCDCDFDLTLSRRGLKPFWLCMIVSWNLPFGPSKTRIPTCTSCRST